MFYPAISRSGRRTDRADRPDLTGKDTRWKTAKFQSTPFTGYEVTVGRPKTASAFRRSLETFDNFFFCCESSRAHPEGAASQTANAYRGTDFPLSTPHLHQPDALSDVSKLNEMETILTRESNWKALYRDDIAFSSLSMRTSPSASPRFIDSARDTEILSRWL